jgi:hypothetical protein
MLCELVGQNNCFGATYCCYSLGEDISTFSTPSEPEISNTERSYSMRTSDVRKIALTCDFSKLAVCFASFSDPFQKTWQAKVQNYEMAQLN